MERNYIDFKFGDHWASEFNLVAVTSGDRYSPPVFGSVNANTTTVAGKTGVYKWKTQIGEKNIVINIAFDRLTMQDVNKIQKWLSPKEVKKLVLSEQPDRFYWCSISSDLDFKYLPFENETIVVNGIEVVTGVYKGEMTLNFLCVDNYAYGEYVNYQDVEIQPNVKYSDSRDANKIIPWITTSNLLNTNSLFNRSDIYLTSFIEAESGNPSTSGISADRAVYLYNAGNQKANLNLKFDYIKPEQNSPITISVYEYSFTEGRKELVSQVQLEYFENFRPFVELYDGVPGNWQIEINSDLCEIYFRHKIDKDKIISLNRFNKEQSFLALADSNFVDYLRPFPTLESEVSESALADTIFNEVVIETSTQNYRLKNVEANWKHTFL